MQGQNWSILRFNVDLSLDVGGNGHEGFLVDSRVAALVEGDDADVEARVLPDDLLRVLVRVERVHEDEGNVAAERLVQALDLEGKIGLTWYNSN